MPVSTPHPQYEKYADCWRKMRDVMEGSRAIKAGQSRYLPRLGDQEFTEYAKYVFRANFFNATARTRDSMEGFIFRKDPRIKVPTTKGAASEKITDVEEEMSDEMKAFMADCDLRGLPFISFCRQSVVQVLDVGRFGVFVDYSDDEQRAFLTPYTSEEIVNWRVGRMGGKMRLTLLVLREWSSEYIPTGDTGEKAPDLFTSRSYEQYRVFQLQDDGAMGAVSMDVYRRKKDKNESATAAATDTSIQIAPQGIAGTLPVTNVQQSIQVFSAVGESDDDWHTVKPQVWLKRRGQGLERIPFVFFGPKDCEPDVHCPPLEDLADINISHYQSSADLEHGRHISGVPTPYFFGAGVNESKDPLILGAGAWTCDDASAKAGFIEVTSKFDALCQALTEKQQQMAALGARMLEIQKKDAETAETVGMRQSGEYASLTNIASATSQALSQVLCWVNWWEGTDADPEDSAADFDVELNLDFIEKAPDPITLQAMCTAYSTNAISFDSLFTWMQNNGFISEDWTIEQEREAIANSPQVIPGGVSMMFGAGGKQGKQQQGQPPAKAPAKEPEKQAGGKQDQKTGDGKE